MNISREEKQWALKISCIAILLTLLPYIAGYALSTKNKQFIGLAVGNSADYNSYLAWMKQAKEGHALFKIKYTTEPHDAVIFHPLFLAIGALSRFTGFPLMLLSHLMRVLSGFFLLFAAYRFIACFLTSPPLRKTAFLLVCFSSGFGGYLLLGKTFLSFFTHCAGQGHLTAACFEHITIPMEDGTLDLQVPEAVTLWSLYGTFLFPFSQALLLLGFLFAYYFVEYRKLSFAAASGLLFCLLFFVHPYDALIAFPVLCVYMLILAAKKNIKLFDPLLAAGLACIFIFSMIPVVYQAWVIHSHSLFAQWVQSPRLSPGIFSLISGFGFPLAFSVYAAFLYARGKQKKENLLFPFTWCALVFVLAYLPVSFQRRLVEGVHIPFCVLGAAGLHSILWRIKEKKQAGGKPYDLQKALRIIVILSSFSNICVFTSELKTLVRKPFPYFISQETKDAFAFLDARTNKEDVVLSSYTIGNFIPAQSGNTVYLGHYDQTLHFQRKLKEVETFYDEKATCRARSRFLKQNHIKYVFFSPEERYFYSAKTLDCPFLQPVFKKESFTLFKVKQ